MTPTPLVRQFHDQHQAARGRIEAAGKSAAHVPSLPSGPAIVAAVRAATLPLHQEIQRLKSANEQLSRRLEIKKVAEATPLRAIQLICCAHFDVNYGDMISDRRTKKLIPVRHVAMYLCRELTPAPLTVIGRAFGKRDHTTVIHACDSVAVKLAKQPELAATVQLIRDECRKALALA